MLITGLLQLAAFVAAAAGGTIAEEGEPISDRPDLVVAQRQSWGLLGLDTCAHAPGRTPLALRIGTHHYAKGLGSHANGEIVVELDGAYERFDAEIGVQWQDGTVGSVIFQVFVDDVAVFTSSTLRPSDAAVPIAIPLAGAQELRLVVTDAGDGITCDCANWADARLVRSATRANPPRFDVAPFAEIRSWDWRQKQGTSAGRLDEFPAADLFPWNVPVRWDWNDRSVPPQDGFSCIGLQWRERRRLARLEIDLMGATPLLDQVRVEQWISGPGDGSQGGSTWQGRWEPMPGRLSAEGSVVSFEPRSAGTTKIRWIIPAPAPGKIATGSDDVWARSIRAWSRSRWRDVELAFEAQPPRVDEYAKFEIYNGEFHTGDRQVDAGMPLVWWLAQPLRLPLTACASPRARGDRTVLRVELGALAFGIAVEDVLATGGVWIPDAGIYVTDASKPVSFSEYRARFEGRRTVLDEVRARPEQTLDAAMARLHSDVQDLGPTLLSLPCDDRKFQLERDGTIRWDDRPEVVDAVDAPPSSPLRCACVVRFGEQREPASERELVDLTCLELELRHRAGAVHSVRSVRSSLRVLVAPLTADSEPLRGPVVGQLLLTAENTGSEPSLASFEVSLSHPAGVRVALVPDGPATIVDGEGHVLAWIDRLAGSAAGPSPIGAIVPTAAGCALRATLAAGAVARWRVLLPRWNAAPTDLARVPDVDGLRANAYHAWQRFLAEMTQIDLPDAALDRLLDASVLHCLAAARGSMQPDGTPRIAPWIASVSYGPLESEAQAVIRGMQLLGARAFAAAAHRYFADRVDGNGRLTTGYTLIGTGWHLWTLGEYDQLFGDEDPTTMRAVAPGVVRACRWIMAQRRKTMLLDGIGRKVPEYGLMPPGPLADWDVFAFYFYANANYCLGLREAAAALARIGDPNAAEIAAEAESFREDLLRAYRFARARAPVVPLRDGRWVPYYPTQLDSHGAIVELYPDEDAGRSWAYDVELGASHLIALGFVEPRSREAGWIVDHLEDVQYLHDGWFAYPAAENERDWFDFGGFSKVQPYYTRTVEGYAARDDVEPFLRSYFNTIPTLLNREDLSFWEHFAASGAWNKTHETGYFLAQTRTLLLTERGDELCLLPFAPRAWLEDAKTIAVRNAPTRFGPVSFRVTSHLAEGWIEGTIDVGGGGTAGLANDSRPRPLPRSLVLRLRLPPGPSTTIRSIRVDGAGAPATFDAAAGLVHIPLPVASIPARFTLRVDVAAAGAPR